MGTHLALLTLLIWSGTGEEAPNGLQTEAQTPLSELWDMEYAETAPLFAETLSESEAPLKTADGKAVRLRRVRYLSHVWKGEEIAIAAHLALPEADAPLPALIMLTANAEAAAQTAASGNIIALALDRVGEGDSTGPRDDYANWLALSEEEDIRNSWMRHYVMSAIRAATYLQTLEEADPRSIGVTGVSRGGLGSLLAAAADPRIRLCMPIAATGAFDGTVGLPDNWIAAALLEPNGLTAKSLEWRRFADHYDPARYTGRIQGLVWIVNGAQDEFFPITSTAALARAAGPNRRLSLIYDADHGYYGMPDGLLDTYPNPGIGVRIGSNLAKAVRTVLRGEGELPRAPELTAAVQERTIAFSAVIDQAASVKAARFLYSVDGAYTFERVELLEPSLPKAGELRVSVGAKRPDSLAAFIEVEYQDAGGSFFITSDPYLTEGFAPRIRPMP